MARIAAEAEGERILLPLSISSTRQYVKGLFNSRGDQTNRLTFKTTGKRIAEGYNRLEKGQAAAIFQLRAEHNPLNHYLARIGASPSDRCQHCSRKETTVHFLLYCPAYKRERRQFRNALKEAEIKIDTRRAALLLDSPEVFPHLAEFVLSTNRFEHLRRYVDLDPTKPQ